MIKRELIRIGIVGGIGYLIAICLLISSVFKSKGESVNWWSLLLPFYLIGMVYAGKILLQALWTIAKVYFSCQIMSLFFNPLWGTLICLVLLCIGLAVIFSCGWLFVGIPKCVYAFVKAYQLDKQCLESQRKKYW